MTGSNGKIAEALMEELWESPINSPCSGGICQRFIEQNVS
jgi:hypothetical protein